MRAYIVVEGHIGTAHHVLTDSNLREIGELTRENILAWLEEQTGPEWIGILPAERFYVCGDGDNNIPRKHS